MKYQKFSFKFLKKTSMIILFILIAKTMSLCHEDMNIINYRTTEYSLNNIVQADQYYLYTFNSNGVLEKRDTNNLYVTLTLKLNRYSKIIGGNGNYLFSKSGDTLYSINKNNLQIVARYTTISDLFIFPK